MSFHERLLIALFTRLLHAFSNAGIAQSKQLTQASPTSKSRAASFSFLHGGKQRNITQKTKSASVMVGGVSGDSTTQPVCVCYGPTMFCWFSGTGTVFCLKEHSPTHTLHPGSLGSGRHVL